MGQPIMISVLRQKDFLALDFEIINFTLDLENGDGGRLTRDSTAEEALLIVHFPTQHIMEEVVPATGGGPPLQPGPLRGRMAGRSRLVFRIPPEIDQISYTLEALLDWSQLEPVLPQVAWQSASIDLPDLDEPNTWTTAVEAPYRLFISPGEDAKWESKGASSFFADGPYPLWHIALTASEPAVSQSIRAIWARENDGEEPAYPQSLDSTDRREFVHLSADFTLENYTPQPVKSRQLWLSSLGAWLDFSAEWEPPAPLSREGWLHRMTMGRDQSVTVLSRGNLYPFGHRASLVKVTRRQAMEFDLLPSTGGALFQQWFIVVKEPLRSYESLPARSHRGIPFQDVRILTTTTQPLQTGEIDPNVFWAQSLDFEDVLFDFVGTDYEGEARPFSAPLVFVRHGFTDEAQILGRYAEGADSRRQIAFHGQPVAFATTAGNDNGRSPADCVLTTEMIEFRGQMSGTTVDPFFPRMAQARVRIPALEALASGGPAPIIAYNDVYLDEGFGAVNSSEVYAGITSLSEIALRSDQSGGLGAPRLVFHALSRTLGPAGAPSGNVDALAKSLFPGPTGPLDYLGQVLGEWKILGILSLKDLISINDANPLDKVPKTLSYADNGNLVTRFNWQTDLQGGAASLTLDVQTTAPRPQPGMPPAAPTVNVNGTLTNITLSLIKDVAEAMDLTFDQITFSSGSERKSTFDAKIKPDGVTFKGPLAFLTELKKVLGDGLSAPPGVDISPRGVKVRYSLGVPSVSIGLFTLQNVAINAGLELPFAEPTTDLPVRLRFAFCDRHRPFLLTVSAFGGGGFVGLEITPEGIALLEASLEFGAAVALNLGVASGSASVMAGIYFRLELQGPIADQGVQLTGYLRVNGSLEVLSMIQISAEFYLGFTWKDPKAWGMARLTVEIEIAFFSKSVSMEIERQFSGTSADPLFGQLMTADDWDQYLMAFA